MDRAKNALITFAQSNGYLPCPDQISGSDGLEDRTGNVCTEVFGKYPYQTVSVAPNDEWGNNLYYAVVTTADTTAVDDATKLASYFNSNSAPFFNLDTPPVDGGSVAGALEICSQTASTCQGSPTTPIEDKVELSAIAVLVSFGKNGEQTWANLGTGAFNAKELENADNDKYFWKHQGSFLEGSDFDDQIVWITGFDIKTAMLKSQLSINE